MRGGEDGGDRGEERKERETIRERGVGSLRNNLNFQQRGWGWGSLGKAFSIFNIVGSASKKGVLTKTIGVFIS